MLSNLLKIIKVEPDFLKDLDSLPFPFVGFRIRKLDVDLI